jgi:GntR family transcriptional regulator/MocR family aminotransferase
MLFSINKNSQTSIQEQLRNTIVAAILNGQLKGGVRLPSTRRLSSDLSVSRTTVVLVYEKLVEDGFLISANRSSFRVREGLPGVSRGGLIQEGGSEKTSLDWQSRFKKKPGQQSNIVKPANWQDYKDPFVYGQPDPVLFPLAAWRECSRQAMSELAMREWTTDAFAQDDPQLVNEIRTKLLPKRGIYADESEILITSGAQNALFLIAAQLMARGTVVGVEDPGYPDARNIFSIQGAELVPIPLDRDGACLSGKANACDYLFLTPSHHSPTNIRMSEERKTAFLKMASLHDQIIIEDDYESDIHSQNNPSLALKALDQTARVIYVGSLSKSIFPGLRLGYIVADRVLISELRAFRRLMLRHAPSNNQRTTSLFIALGYHDTYIRKLHRIYKERREIMKDCLDKDLPGLCRIPDAGGTSFWMQGDDVMDAENLARRALEKEVVIEPGHLHFFEPEKNRNFFRLGFSSIDGARIPDGIRAIASLMPTE